MKPCQKCNRPGPGNCHVLLKLSSGPFLQVFCPKCFAKADRATRTSWWQRRRDPDVTIGKGHPDALAYYVSTTFRIAVLPSFAERDRFEMVVALSHETLHHVLTREFGEYTSHALDNIDQWPMVCLGQKSPWQFLVELLTG